MLWCWLFILTFGDFSIGLCVDCAVLMGLRCCCDGCVAIVMSGFVWFGCLAARFVLFRLIHSSLLAWFCCGFCDGCYLDWCCGVDCEVADYVFAFVFSLGGWYCVFG